MNVVKVPVEFTCSLRRDLLGWIDLVTESDLTPSAAHFAAFEERELIGIGSVGLEACPDLGNQNAARIWGIAVSEQRRGTGAGKIIVEEMSAYSVDLGAKILWANARETALGFYEKLGFTISNTKVINKNSGLTNQRIYRHL